MQCMQSAIVYVLWFMSIRLSVRILLYARTQYEKQQPNFIWSNQMRRIFTRSIINADARLACSSNLLVEGCQRADHYWSHISQWTSYGRWFTLQWTKLHALMNINLNHTFVNEFFNWILWLNTTYNIQRELNCFTVFPFKSLKQLQHGHFTKLWPA